MLNEPHPPWLTQFDGRELAAKLDVSAILGTVDADGWPHLAYLSAGEILVQDERISLILWPQSETCSNLRRSSQAVLHVAGEGAIWEARLKLRPRDNADDHPGVFDGEVVALRRHSAPYADVLGLISFRLHDAPATLLRWAGKLATLRDED